MHNKLIAKWILISTLCLFVAACGSKQQISPTAASTSKGTEVLSTMPPRAETTLTPTIVPTETAPAVAEIKSLMEYFGTLNPTLEAEGITSSGLQVKGDFVSEQATLRKFEFDFEKDFANEYIARKIAIMVLTQGPNPMDEMPSDADVAAMQQKMAQVQRGEDKDVSSVLVTMPVFDLNGTEKRYVERKLIIFPGNADLSNLPADTIVINDVHNFAFSGVERNDDGTLKKRKGVPGMLWTHEAGNAGGIIIDGNEMWLYFGPSYFYSTATRDFELAAASLTLEKLIVSGRGTDINPNFRALEDDIYALMAKGFKTK